MAWTILQSDFVIYAVLPFLLVFTVIFGILEKSKIFGEGKKQIDAIVSLVIGLIVISYSYATGIIVGLVPVMAVGVVIILVFLILFGFVFKEGDFKIHWGLQLAFGILAGIAVIIAVLVLTGAWTYVTSWFNGSGAGSSTLVSSIVLIIIVVAVVAIVVGTGGKPSGKPSGSP